MLVRHSPVAQIESEGGSDMMIDDNTLKQLLRINDELLQLCKCDSGDITARARQAIDKPKSDWIPSRHQHNRDRPGRLLGRTDSPRQRAPIDRPFLVLRALVRKLD
jgi:hypothetical protein